MTSHQPQLKEIKMRYQIAQHDLETKARQAQRFLESGDRVRASIQLRGREAAHTDLAVVVLDKFVRITGAAVDRAVKVDGKIVSVILRRK